MYRITKIQDLPHSNFNIGDKILSINEHLNQMDVQDVPNKQYRTASYLSSSINVLNSSFNELSNFDKLIENVYFTDEVSARYIHKNSLIHPSDVSKVLTIGSIGGLLTKNDAENMKTECISLIHQLKEKAMNMFTAKLDIVFRTQQSMLSKPIGGFDKNSGVGGIDLAVSDEENFTPNINNHASNYDFIKGQFSLYHLLTQFDTLSADVDFWEENIFDNNTFDYNKYPTVASIIEDVNALSDNSAEALYGFCNQDEFGRIIIPECLFDTFEQKTIPVATIVFEILKRQIYIVIKNIYMQYLIKLTTMHEDK